jgi:hypothetical protein
MKDLNFTVFVIHPLSRAYLKALLDNIIGEQKAALTLSGK